MSIRCVGVLAEVLFERAQWFRWQWIESPVEMRKSAFRRSSEDANEVVDQQEYEASQRYSKAAIIDVAAVLLGTLGESADESRASVGSALRSYHVQAAMARTWLETCYKENIYLFLVAPPGAIAERRWIDLAYEIERNERICRKLVWLPKAEEATWRDDAKFFCERVFSAPFGTHTTDSVQELDPIGKVFGKNGFPASWLEILLRAPAGGDAVAKDLIDALRVGRTG